MSVYNVSIQCQYIPSTKLVQFTGALLYLQLHLTLMSTLTYLLTYLLTYSDIMLEHLLTESLKMVK
jgi:hypothetical protein